MTKSDERAVHARSLILKGEQKSVVAERLGYKSVGGMMGSIAMMEHKEKMSGQRFKTKRAMQSPSAVEVLKEKKEDKLDILGGGRVAGAARRRPEEFGRAVCEDGEQASAGQLHRLQKVAEYQCEAGTQQADSPV